MAPVLRWWEDEKVGGGRREGRGGGPTWEASHPSQSSLSPGLEGFPATLFLVGITPNARRPLTEQEQAQLVLRFRFGVAAICFG